MTTHSIPLAGVVGWPVAHSRSPALHGHWLSRYEIKGQYVALGVKAQNFESAIRSLPQLGFKGVNITIPYKETVLSLATTVTDRASLIGAANTLIFRDDGVIHADNTDGYGFVQNLRQNAPGWDARHGPALVLGAGGASRAIISALLAEGAPEVRITNRTRHRADMLKDQFGAKVTVFDWVHRNKATEGVTTLVNTTSLGMQNNPELTIRLDACHPSAVVNDIVYTPLITPLLEDAADRGLHAVDGLGMLLHQGVPGFEMWFDRRPEVDETLRQAVLRA